MERCGFIPELIFWNSFEEEMQFEETNAMPPLLDLVTDHRSGLTSMIWPDNYDGGNGVYCYSDDPNASYDQSTNDHAMEDEQFAASFIQIDAAYQFEGLLSPNEASSHDFICTPWINASPEECNNFDAVITAGSSKKKKADELSSTVQRPAKKLRSKKKKKVCEAGQEEVLSNAGLNVQSTSSCSSEENQRLNSSQESNEGGSTSSGSKRTTALNITGRARAERGGATDPQSLYARKRRERINERLRILQNLVPNGTKVDISTMLEEAVQYVKFLQLQIQLLSSDKLWKYAPLAYNGMNVELDSMIRAITQ